MGSHQSVELRNGDTSQQDALFETQKRVAHVIVKLATKAQFSKVDLSKSRSWKRYLFQPRHITCQTAFL